MGRSVDYLSGALAVAYIETEDFTGVCLDDPDSSYFFSEASDCIVEQLRLLWPSFEEADGWDGRETRVIAKNGHAVVGVSEYCGLTSVSIAANGQCEYPELAEHWISQIAEKFVATFGNLRKIGPFSNGESVYERTG